MLHQYKKSLLISWLVLIRLSNNSFDKNRKLNTRTKRLFLLQWNESYCSKCDKICNNCVNEIYETKQGKTVHFVLFWIRICSKNTTIFWSKLNNHNYEINPFGTGVYYIDCIWLAPLFFFKLVLFMWSRKCFN